MEDDESDLEIAFEGGESEDDFDENEDDVLSGQWDDEEEDGESEVEDDEGDDDDDEEEFVKPRRFEEEFDNISELGSGAFGKVFKARHKNDEQFYAVKMVELDVDETEKGKQLRECRKLALINHPGIVRYYSSWIDRKYVSLEERAQRRSESEERKPLQSGKGNRASSSGNSESSGSASDVSGYETESSRISSDCLYIQMELCGETLKSLIEKDVEMDPLDKKLKYLSIFAGVVEALGHMHDQGLIHRDLKPDNVFRSLTEPNLFKIGDWGSVKDDDLNAEDDGLISSVYSSYFGTQGYAAPEITKKAFYNSMVDVYSLGSILLNLTFPNAMLQELQEIKGKLKNSHESGNSPMCWPQSLEELLKNTLSDDISQRPRTKQLCQAVNDTMDEIRDMQKLEKEFSVDTILPDIHLSEEVQLHIQNSTMSLKECDMIILEGNHGVQKTTAALKTASYLRSEGYIILLTDLTRARSPTSIYKRMLSTLKVSFSETDVDSYIRLIHSALNQHISRKHKFLWVLKNLGETFLPRLNFLNHFNESLKTIVTMQCPPESSMFTALMPYSTVSFKENNALVLKLKSVLQEPPQDENAEGIIQAFPTSKQKMLLLLSYLPGVEGENKALQMILKQMKSKSTSFSFFMKELEDSGVLRNISSNRMDLHWYLKELIIKHTLPHRLLVRRAIFSGLLKSLVHKACEYWSKEGSSKKLQESDITYSYFHKILFHWVKVKKQKPLEFSVWSRIPPIVLYHAIQYLDVHEISGYDQILQGLLHISSVYPYSAEKGDAKTTMLLIRSLIADNERRLGKVNEAVQRVEEDVKEIAELRDSTNGLFVKSYASYLRGRVLAERTSGPSDNAKERYKNITQWREDSVNLFTSCQALPLPSSGKGSDDAFVSARIKLTYLPCYMLFVRKNQLLFQVRSSSRKSLMKSIADLESFLKLLEFSLGDHPFIGRYLKDYGDFLLEKEEYEKASAIYSKSSEIYQQDPYSTEYVMLLQNWGMTKCYLGKVSEGMADFDKAIQIVSRKSSPEQSKYGFKLFVRQSSALYRFYMERGIKGLDVASNLNLLSQTYYKKMLENLLGQSIVRAFEEGVDKSVMKDPKFRRWMCPQKENCKRGNSCKGAHEFKDQRK